MACGLVIAAACFMSFPTCISNGSDWWRDPLRWVVDVVAAGAWPILAFVALQVLLAYTLGLLLWRMAVMAVAVARMGSTFDFDLNRQHPDQAAASAPPATSASPTP